MHVPRLTCDGSTVPGLARPCWMRVSAAQAAKLGKPVAEIASGKAAAPFNALSTAVLSNTSEEGAAAPEAKAGSGAKPSFVGGLKSMLAKKEKAAA